MLKQENVLESMKKSFPRWSDIRKRTKKSTGGRLLTAYSNEFDNIQQAIEDYQKLFFLASYKDHEADVVDYLYLAFVGRDDNFKMVDPVCEITTNPDEFYDNLDTMCFYQEGYILIHENLLGDRKSIRYSVDEGYEYESKCYYEHIWNAFDEFALFAGINRQEGEKNLSLATRTYNVFKQFPNASEDGLKNAIVNVIKTIRDIDPEAIEILPIDKDHLNTKNKEMAEIYEDFLQYNKDVFRSKIWNQSLWEHPFQKTDFIPHKWDAEMEITQDGVGSNNSLKIDYIKKLNQNDITDVSVDAYKKDFETIRQYVGKSNIEASLQLTLTKYSDDIKPKDVTVKIHAYDAVRLETPSSITIHEMQNCSGESTFYIDDIATNLHNVTRIENGRLDPSTKYQLRFTPKESFSDMSISKCLLTTGTTKKDLRKENSSFKFDRGTLRNTRVFAHVDNMSELTYNDNIISAGKGFTVGSVRGDGTFGFDVTGMGGQMINYDVSCRQVDITDSEYVSANNGFTLDSDRRGYTNSTSTSLGYVEIGARSDYKMSCNSYSFEFAAASDSSKQGAIEVTVTADGKTTTTLYTKPCTIKEEFKKSTETQIVIRKHGLYPVQIRNIRIASYDIDMSLSDGTPLEYVGKIVRLPNDVDGKTLKVRVSPHTSIYPVINYVHVGLSLTGSRYEVEFTTESGTPVLDIDTDCDVTLYKIAGNGTRTVVGTEKEYSTKASFMNSSNAQGQIVINTEDFTNIVSSTPEIHKKFNGTAQNYIVLNPGETISTIVINGDVSRTLSAYSLTHILSNDNYANKEYYVTSGYVGAMFIKDTNSGTVSRVTITKDMLNQRADTFKVTGLPSNVAARYTSRGGYSKNTNTLNSDPFDELCLIYEASVEHVAYNKVPMITDYKDEIEVVNTFSPLMSANTMAVYEIEMPKNLTDHIEFGTSEDLWSLGVDPMGYSILTTMETQNAETWQLEISHVNNKYILDNEIPLDTRYLIDGAYHDLAEYMVTPEKGLVIECINSDETETITANRYANKLHYSNVKGVKLYKGSTRITSGFTVMEREGLILWDNSAYNGQSIKVVYTALVPDSITYTEEFSDRLYGLIAFKAEAYKHVGSRQFQNLSNGDTVVFEAMEDADRLVTKCSNPCFQAIINGDKLYVSQIKEEDKLAIHNGYIYDAGLEFWYFNDKYDDGVDKMKNVELHDVTRLADKWLFHMAAHNYLPYSTMSTSVMSKLCDIDFTKRLPVPISEFYHLTACDTYNLWYFIDMKGEMVKSLNGYGIRFKVADNESTGYAAAEITRFIKKGNIISLYTTGDLQISLVEETKMNDLPFSKSVCFDAKKATELEAAGDFRYFIVNKEPEKFTRYYLFVQGKDGQIDDIISMPYKSEVEMIESHKKNIDRLGFNIHEALPVDYEYDIEFERSGCKYTDLQCNSQTWELSTSSTIEYGLTLIESSNIEKCYLDGAIYKKGRIILATSDAKVTTRSFYVRNQSSVYELDIKVNDIAAGKYRDFDIKVYGSPSENGAYILLGEAKKSNTITIPIENIKSYIYIEVTGKKNNVIYSIETYARYAEREGAAKLVPIPKDSGELVTKIYDLGTSANYRFDGVDADIVEGTAEDVQYYVRGARENDATLVFTDWKKYNLDANDINQIVLQDYHIFQFKAVLSSADVTVRIHNFKLTVV